MDPLLAISKNKHEWPKNMQSSFWSWNKIWKTRHTRASTYKKGPTYLLTGRASHISEWRERNQLGWYNTAGTLLRGWRANCNIKLLLYYLNPNCLDMSEIEDVSRYVVSYMGKRHNTSQSEIDAIQNIIMKWVKTWHIIRLLNNMYKSPRINERIICFLNDMYHLTCYTFETT